MKIKFEDEFEVMRWAEGNGGPTAVVIALKTDKFSEDEVTQAALDEYFLLEDGSDDHVKFKIEQLRLKQERLKQEHEFKSALFDIEHESVNSKINLMTAKWTRIAGAATFLGVVIALAGPAESLAFVKSIWVGIKGLFSKS